MSYRNCKFLCKILEPVTLRMPNRKGQENTFKKIQNGEKDAVLKLKKKNIFYSSEN